MLAAIASPAATTPVQRFPSRRSRVTCWPERNSAPACCAARIAPRVSARLSTEASSGRSAAARTSPLNAGSSSRASSMRSASAARPSPWWSAMSVLSSRSASRAKNVCSVPFGRNPAFSPESSSIAATNSGYSARLARPSGTIGNAAGLSGAGERIPAAAQEASRPGCWRSSTTTRSLLRASSHAMELPMMPPPIIAAS